MDSFLQESITTKGDNMSEKPLPGRTGREEVFISYASGDREKVTPIVRDLRNAGVSAWIDQGGIDGALLWGQEIVEAIDNCRVMILMVSQASVESFNVVKEVALASEGRKHILPLHLEPTEIPATMRYQLAGIQHIELFRGDEKDIFNTVIRSLSRLGVKTKDVIPSTAKPGSEIMDRMLAAASTPSMPEKTETAGKDAVSEQKESRNIFEFKRIITHEDMNAPCLIKLDSEGNLFVADSGNDRILKFSSGGEFLLSWGGRGNDRGKFNKPVGIAVDDNGNILVTDNQQSRIQKFTSEGEFIDVWGSHVNMGGDFHVPRGIAVDADRNIYVTDGYPGHPKAPPRVQKFTSGGDFLESWGYEGSDEHILMFPYGIAVDREGKVYVADTHNHCVQVYDSGGKHLMKLETGEKKIFGSGFSSPVGIDLDNEGNIYFTNSSGLRIYRFNPLGEITAQWGDRGFEDSKFLGMSGIAVSSSGLLYVADDKVNCIKVFSI